MNKESEDEMSYSKLQPEDTIHCPKTRSTFHNDVSHASFCTTKEQRLKRYPEQQQQEYGEKPFQAVPTTNNDDDNKEAISHLQ